MRSTCEAGANQAKTWERNGETGRAGKNQKKKIKKTNKNQDCTPQGEGVRCRVLGLVFFFVFFFGFLVCVWIAIADVPSRDCQALSVVALEARSIQQYSNVCYLLWRSAFSQWTAERNGIQFCPVCAICCWIFAQEMLQFAHSPGGLFWKKRLEWLIHSFELVGHGSLKPYQTAWWASIISIVWQRRFSEWQQYGVLSHLLQIEDHRNAWCLWCHRSPCKWSWDVLAKWTMLICMFVLWTGFAFTANFAWKKFNADLS